MIRAASLFATIIAIYFAATPDPVKPDPQSPRPIEALDSVFIEDLTWMEIRDAMSAGKDTIIIPTGGIEQNGPYLALGKHNIILKGTTEAIARKLKNALVTPIVAFVPEGDIDPPSLHMLYPGSISLTEETYERLLTDLCSCMRVHGFKHIVLIGDSGGNQEGLKNVAAALNAKWNTGQSKVHYIPEYYNFDKVGEWLKQQGIRETFEGIHDEFCISAMMMAVDPQSVRAKQRIAANKFRINGIDLAPMEKTIEWGKKIIDFRADLAVKAINAARSQ